jgi:hypothetical protein
MVRMELRVATDGMREHVVLELLRGGKPLGQIQLDGDTAEKHVHDVARHRANLIDPVTRTLKPGARLEALIDPAWGTPKYQLPEGRILSFRHPGLGWLTFVLPDEEATAIAEWLTKDLPIRPQAE